MGELWLVTPTEQKKLYDIHDVAVSVAANSQNGDVTGELVDVGLGTRAEDYAGKDLKGKVAIGGGGVAQIFAMASQRGAIGAVGYSTLYPDRGVDVIPSSSIAVNAQGFGWAVSPRQGHELVARLARGEKLSLRSVIKAETMPGELETVHATIAGDPSSTQDVIISGHLYEGYLKQGANDDNSGCALTLEVGRAYIKLVSEGKLPKPKHTIHFLWVPEISGTNAWLKAHPDIARRVIADLNFDMEGIRLSTSRSYWILQRTPDTFPSFLNDIGQSMMEFVVGDHARAHPLPRQRLCAEPRRAVAQRQRRCVLHQDRQALWLERSRDLHAARDPGGDVHHLARQLVSLVAGHARQAGLHAVQARRRGGDRGDDGAGDRRRRDGGAGRLGESVARRRADGRVVSQGAFATWRTRQRRLAAARVREAVVAITHQAMVEKGVVRSARALFDNPADGEKKVQVFEPLIDKRAAALLDEAKAAYALQAAQRRTPAAEPTMTAEERDASTLSIECVNGSSFSGCCAGSWCGGSWRRTRRRWWRRRTRRAGGAGSRST